MKVIAKFLCQDVTLYNGGSRSVRLTPVTGGSEENTKFWKYTPSGELRMQIDNPPASEMFEPGGEYYLTFEKA
ncbi:MAG: hypothetical protein AB7I04_18525 [Pseudomonadales bacterium]